MRRFLLLLSGLLAAGASAQTTLTTSNLRLGTTRLDTGTIDVFYSASPDLTGTPNVSCNITAPGALATCTASASGTITVRINATAMGRTAVVYAIPVPTSGTFDLTSYGALASGSALAELADAQQYSGSSGAAASGTTDTTARTAASNAQSTANTALSTAQSAQTAATNAGTAASNAQSAAGTANTNASSALSAANTALQKVSSVTPVLRNLNTQVGKTYFVSQSLGDDNANNGLSMAAPWKTIAKINSISLNPCDSVYLRDGDTWHERLNIYARGTSACKVTFSDYGDRNLGKPVIDGADVVDSTKWTNYSGNTYMTPYTKPVTKGFVDDDPVPFVLETSAANVVSNPGSLYSDSTNLYVQLQSGDSPANHVVEISANDDNRDYGVFAQDANYVTMQNIHVIRTTRSGIAFGQSGDNTSASSPTLNEYNTIQDSQFDNVGSTTGDAYYGEQGAILVHARNTSGQHGLHGWVLKNNKVGRVDVNYNLDYGTAGIQIMGTVGADVEANNFATVMAMGFQARDEGANQGVGSATLTKGNTFTNNQGNLSSEEPYSISQNDSVTDSYGFCFQLGSHGRIDGFNCNGVSPTLDPGAGLYNGDDENGATDIVISNSHFSGIMGGCALDFEGGATNFTVTHTTVSGVGGDGCLTNITSNSMAGSNMIDITYTETPGITNGFHVGGTGANGADAHTRSEFWQMAPNNGGDTQYLIGKDQMNQSLQTLANRDAAYRFDYVDSFLYTGSLGAGWTVNGTFNAINGGLQSANTNQTDQAYWTSSVLPADQHACVVLGNVSNGGNTPGPGVRMGPGGVGYVTYISQQNGYQLYAGGSQLKPAPGNPVSGDKICLDINGYTLDLVDVTTGVVLLGGVVDPNSLYANGYPGINNYGNNNNNTITSWSAGANLTGSGTVQACLDSHGNLTRCTP